MNKEIKKHIFHNILLVAAIVLLNCIAASCSGFFEGYVFLPLQVFRCWLFQFIPFSIGDIFYLFLACAAFYFLFKAIRKIGTYNKVTFVIGLLNLTKVLLLFYCALLMLWGVKYEQPKLAERLALSTDSVVESDLYYFDSLLITRLNDLQQFHVASGLSEINEIASAAYSNMHIPVHVFAKQSLMGNGLAYFGIEGYFNPFTGEAQINPNIPNFMMPFLVTHEMAHQTGIAAEDDANLLAYIACIESANKSFQYSAYLNVWMYTHQKVYRADSLKAISLKQTLNPVTKGHLILLKQRSIQYHTFLDDWSTYIFDAFLKLGNQHDGIASYRNVAYSALCWERKRKQALDTVH
ncbi:MAG: DUF3810 family protein [Bacteroidota bacterium]